MVALDVDGTLLNPEHHVTPRVTTAIQQALERGLFVLLCTGRTFTYGIQGLAKELGLSLPAIVRNGAAVQDTATGEVLEQRVLSEDVKRQALDIMFAAGSSPVVQEGPRRGEALFTLPPEKCHPAVAFYEQWWRGSGTMTHVHRPGLYEALEATWIGACGDSAIAERAYGALQQIVRVRTYWTGVAGRQTEPDYHVAAIQPEGCTKAAALADFAAQHGIRLDEVLAVGDYLNDVEMLAEVGWGVAMGQAPAEVKAAANAVVPDNAHDGAAIAIERWVLSQD
jgi:hypothetical protein